MTGMGPSEQLERPFPPPEVPRRPTGSTHTDSTEADTPPLMCRPDYRLSTTAAVALSSPTKVIVRFVFGLVFFLHRTLYERENWELKIGTVFLRFDRKLPPPPLLCRTNQPPILPSNQPTKAAFRWVREEKLASFFVPFHFSFCLFCCIFSLTLFTPLWLFCIVNH